MNNNLHFDQLDEHFHEKIYRSFKGKLRLAVLHKDFTALQFHHTPLKVLDIGGGSGIFSLSLAQKNHQITLVEPSGEMLMHAKHNFAKKGVEATFIQAKAESLDQFEVDHDFDLILCHAVLEWTENPEQILSKIEQYLRPKGHLSLLFYNRQGLILHNLIRGNFRLLQQAQFQRHEGSLTPTNPLLPREIEGILHRLNFSQKSHSGIRVFHDYMTKKNQEKITLEERLAMELKFSNEPDFIHTARYLHWIYQKQ